MSFLKTVIGANALVLAFSFAFIGEAQAQYSSPAFHAQRVSLKSRIDFALNSGQINASQASNLTDAITASYSAQEHCMVDGSINLTESQQIEAGLRSIETSLNTLISQNIGNGTAVRPNDGNWRGDWGSRRNHNADEVNSLRSAAESKVSTALAGGKITATQAGTVRALLTTSATQQASFMVDGRIDSREKDELSRGIKAAEDNLDSLIRVNLANNSNSQFGFYNKNWWNRSWNSSLNSSMVSRLSKLSERIERGKMRGSLTANEYASLKADLDRLATPNQFGFRGRNSRWDRMSFETAVNNLEMRVRAEITDRETARRGFYF